MCIRDRDTRVAGRGGEELIERSRVEPLRDGDRAGLRDSGHGGAGDEVVAELRRLACAIAVREGLDPGTLYELLTASTGDSRVLRTRYPLPGVDVAHPASNAFAPLFALDLIAKDLALARELAADHGVEVHVADAALDAYRAAQRDGRGALDYSAVYRRGDGPEASD